MSFERQKVIMLNGLLSSLSLVSLNFKEFTDLGRFLCPIFS